MKIDLNSDIGESFGAYTIGADEKLMPFITSANLACGFHGGDPDVMQRTVQLCHAHGVSVGAHPGYPDLAGFGRRVVSMSAAQVENMVLYQLGALAAFTRAYAVPLRHVKPHGALYNHAARDMPTARAIAQAVARFDSNLILVGLANSALIDARAPSASPWRAKDLLTAPIKMTGRSWRATKRARWIHRPNAPSRSRCVSCARARSAPSPAKKSRCQWIRCAFMAIRRARRHWRTRYTTRCARKASR